MMIRVKVITRASKNEIVAKDENNIKIKLTTVPHNGKANLSLRRLLAKEYNTAVNNVVIKQGEHSSHKLVEIRV